MLQTVSREEGAAFEPDAIAAMAVAHRAILQELGLSEGNGAAARAVARCVIKCAAQGEHDPVRLKDATLEALSR